MTTVVSLLAVATLAAVFSVYLRRPFEIMLPVAISGIMLTLWIFGYVISLQWLTYVLWVAAAASVVVLILLPRRHLGVLLTPGTLIFFGVVLFLAIAGQDLILLSWDEFSHWGQVTRFLAVTGRYPERGEILFDGYPFGTGILQAVLGGNTEPNWILVNSAFKLAALLPLLSYIRLRRPVEIFAIGIFAASTLSFFVWMGSLVEITTDMPLALYAGAALIIYFKERGSLTGILLAIPVTASLPLIKEIGLILAFFVGVVIFIDQIALLIARSNRSLIVPAVSLAPALAAVAVDRLRSAMLETTVGQPLTLSWATVSQGVQAPTFGTRTIQTVEYFFHSLTQWPMTISGQAIPGVLLLIASVIAGGTVAFGRQWYRPVGFLLVGVAGLAAYLLLLLTLVSVHKEVE
ncbi:hypothetical protein VQ045_21645 [Aurantimonas sp. E1-2-R+4]|uniref:hypothetical protein n=1 Tax=Aurantimonas sp. E1-2-R+4 TaxID=3113714 RepID=UPI002F9384C8